MRLWGIFIFLLIIFPEVLLASICNTKLEQIKSAVGQVEAEAPTSDQEEFASDWVLAQNRILQTIWAKSIGAEEGRKSPLPDPALRADVYAERLDEVLASDDLLLARAAKSAKPWDRKKKWNGEKYTRNQFNLIRARHFRESIRYAFRNMKLKQFNFDVILSKKGTVLYAGIEADNVFWIKSEGRRIKVKVVLNVYEKPEASFSASDGEPIKNPQRAYLNQFIKMATDFPTPGEYLLPSAREESR